MHAYQLSVAYKNADGQKITSDLITSDFEIKTEPSDDRLKMTVLPKSEIEITEFALTFPYHYVKSNRIFVNG